MCAVRYERSEPVRVEDVPDRATILSGVLESLARGALEASLIETLSFDAADDALRRVLSPEGAHTTLVLTM